MSYMRRDDRLTLTLHLLLHMAQQPEHAMTSQEMAACAQSVRLTMQEMDLHLELGQLPWPPEHVPELLEAIVSGHRAVVDAIEDRDEARARALTQEHIETRTLWSIELRLQRVGDDGAADAREVS